MIPRDEVISLLQCEMYYNVAQQVDNSLLLQLSDWACRFDTLGGGSRIVSDMLFHMLMDLKLVDF